MEGLLVPLVGLAQVALVGLVVMAVARRLEQKAQIRADLQLKLLERIGSVEELERFLASDTGRQVLGLYTSPAHSPLSRVVVTAQVGVALLVAGLGVLVVAFASGNRMPMAAGVLVIAAGLGLLAAVAVARRLSKAWGLEGGGAAKPAGGVSTVPAARA